MRGATLAIAVVLAATNVAAEPLAFDHAGHAPLAIPCARCHPIKQGLLVGTPSARTCSGNGCHATLPPATPRAPAADHALVLGHRVHADVGCAQCHDQRVLHRSLGRTASGAPDGLARSVRRPHQRCASCHATRGPAMTACERCHVLAPDAPGGPHLAVTDLRVTTAFSHARHAPRGAARQCATCHPGIANTDDRVLPRPTARACATSGCHDAAPVFGITATCTRCHQDAPRTTYKVVRDGKRFLHAQPEHAAANLACTTCHPFGKASEIVVVGHGPCATCHADDFTRREPTICNACHNGTEPWRPLVADRLPAQTTEFGASLDHGKHAAIACTSCHALATQHVELRPPRGHAACRASGCHELDKGPAPTLSRCEGCHVRDLAAERDRERRAARWSVRATFVHAPHRVVGGVEIACTSCHTDLSAPTVRTLAAPAKPNCLPCHDGRVAFKLTGTSCMRCHPGGAR
jgi:predicted CXXCH cytochrome family protein